MVANSTGTNYDRPGICDDGTYAGSNYFGTNASDLVKSTVCCGRDLQATILIEGDFDFRKHLMVTVLLRHNEARKHVF